MTLSRPLVLMIAGSLIACSSASAQNLSERLAHVQQQRTKAESNNSSKAHMLGTLLYTDISVQFSNTKARDAINYLATTLGINIVARYNDDKTGEGLDPEAMITLNSTDQPALTVLEMVLAQAAADEETTWQLREGFVEVGTKDRLSAKSAQIVKYYPIRDLLFEPPHFDNAPKLDLDAALNQGGGGGSGGGGGGSGGGGGGGFGGGGGGSGGGGGGSGGGGGGGSLFGEPGEDPERLTEIEKAEQIQNIITDTVETEAWDVNGGSAATIRYYQGTFIIRAPDYIHRQIGGYPFAPRPVGRAASAGGGRYVMFTGSLSNVELKDIRVSPALGGTTGGSGGSGDGGAPATGGTPPATTPPAKTPPSTPPATPPSNTPKKP